MAKSLFLKISMKRELLNSPRTELAANLLAVSMSGNAVARLPVGFVQL